MAAVAEVVGTTNKDDPREQIQDVLNFCGTVVEDGSCQTSWYSASVAERHME